MKTRFTLFISFYLLAVTAGYTQIETTLESFEKIIVGPKINLELREGTTPALKLEFSGIEEHRINYEVDGKTLKIYLDDARYVERHIRWDNRWRGYDSKMYRGVKITAYVTYNQLTTLEARGEEDIVAHDVIVSEQFRLRLYGDNEVRMAGVDSDLFKAQLYGDNQLEINGGGANEQVFRLYGDNEVDCTAFPSTLVRTACYGDSHLQIRGDEIKITAFGDATIEYAGDADIDKGIVIGDASIRRLHNFK